MTYNVLAKRLDRDPRGDGHSFVLVVQRPGYKNSRETVVSPPTWDAARIGGSVELPERG